MSRFLRQSTASQTRTIGPFVDSTDFVTAEDGLTIANTDIRVKKNGAADVAKNSGGGTADVNGCYAVTWDATDTDTVGELFYTVKVAGALQVFGSFTVLEEAVYDALFGASAAGYGTAQTGDSFAIVNSGTHGNAALKTLIDTVDNFVDTEISTIISTLGTPAGASISADILTIDNLVDDLESRIGTPSNLGGGATVAANLSDIEAQTDDIGVAGAGLTDLGGMSTTMKAQVESEVDDALGGGTGTALTAIPWNASWDTEVQSECADALVAYDGLVPADLPTNFAALGINASGHVSRVTLTDTLTTYTGNTVQTGDAFARLGAPAGASVSADIAAVQADNPNRPTRAVELANLMFMMVDATDLNTPETGVTVTATISKDGGAFASCTNSVSEVSGGWYKITLTATELTADSVAVKFSGTGCAQRNIAFRTQPT